MATSMPIASEPPRASEAPDAETRHLFVTGSQAYWLFNEQHYGKGCARALAYEKLRTPQDVPTVDAKERALSLGAILNRGHLLEDLVARLYMQATGRSVIRKPRLVMHPDHPGAGVHVDRIILSHRVVATDEIVPTGDLEIKTHSEGPFLNAMRNGLPIAHLIQMQWGNFCTGHEWSSCAMVGVFGELPLRWFDIKRDPMWMNLFAHAVENFWNTLKAGDLPPQLPDASDIRCKLCPYRLTCRGESIDPEEYAHFMHDKDRKKPLIHIRNAELDEALADRALIKSEIEALDHGGENDPGALQLINRRISELLGDQDAVEVNDRWRVYQSDGSWSGLDQERLHKEQPEIYKKYYISKRPTGSKRLRVYAISANPASVSNVEAEIDDSRFNR